MVMLEKSNLHLIQMLQFPLNWKNHFFLIWISYLLQTIIHLTAYEQLVDYKNNHSKFSKIGVYPAEEVTTDKEAHILVYGLHKEIKSGQSLDEISR